MSELKLCPFCGGETLSVEELSSAWFSGNSQDHVICDNCACSAPEVSWNTRADSSQIEKLEADKADLLAVAFNLINGWDCEELAHCAGVDHGTASRVLKLLGLDR